MASPSADATRLDAIVVGAGFAGLYALHRLEKEGFRVRAFEAAPDVGGTWYWNTYPGARCDAQSIVYCYMFDEALHRDWKWSEHYATQPEILRYLQYVADRYDLRHRISFSTRIERAWFDDVRKEWIVATDHGEEVRTRWLFLATGALSVGRLPDIAGIESFKGQSCHTGSWPREGVDFTGKRVAVIGTGSSGVQIIPEIAQQAAQMTVFQRTPAFVAPARSREISEAEREEFAREFDEYRWRMRRGDMSGIGDVLLSGHLPPPHPSAAGIPPEEIDTLLEGRWGVGGALVMRLFRDLMINRETNNIVADFFRKKIREVVTDPEVADRLTPRDYPFGSKRICIGSGYYETFNRKNVRLIDISSNPIRRITEDGIELEDEQLEFDTIVYATGFDAITGALLSMDIRGKGGDSLKEAWSQGARSYLGLAVADFPNLFTITGPGSPASLSTVTVSIEQHVDWLADLMIHARSHGFTQIEAGAEAQARWCEQVQEAVERTLFLQGKSWYRGANIPGKPQVFLAYVGGVGTYRQICDDVAADGYRGLEFSR